MDKNNAGLLFKSSTVLKGYKMSNNVVPETANLNPNESAERPNLDEATPSVNLILSSLADGLRRMPIIHGRKFPMATRKDKISWRWIVTMVLAITFAGQAAGESDSNIAVNASFFDAGLFARVVTFNPDQQDGITSSRYETFREDEVFLEADIPADENGNYRAHRPQDGRGSAKGIRSAHALRERA
jgi:hypothetical protein